MRNSWNDEAKMECPDMCGEPRENMTELMMTNMNLSIGVMVTASKINAHLFGFGNPVEDEKIEAKCLQDDMQNQRRCLETALSVLEKICRQLGA